MERLLIAAAIVVVAIVIAVVARRRRPDAPTQAPGSVPTQIDRRDFDRPDAPWLVAVFTSATCHTCRDVGAAADSLASDDVAVTEVSFETDRELHARYHIDAVPTLIVADADGVVRESVLGPVSAAELRSTLVGLRDGGSSR